MTRNPFSVLGVSSSATEDEIKSAYRKLAKKYHPDLNPGDKAAEQKMKEVNEAYAEALRLKKTGETWRPDGGPGGFGGASGFGGYGGYGSYGGYGNRYESRNASGWGGENPWGSYQRQSQGDPFGFGFDFDPFGFGSRQRSTRFRTRNYANPELKTAENHVLARRYQDALNTLNRIPTHDADWHALYARADYALGNRISGLQHAKQAAGMAPGDADYQSLLREMESGREAYREARQSGYDFRSVLCGNPFLTCCALNVFLNCCFGGRFMLCC